MPLDSSDSANNARISEESAHRLLARAAELDAHIGGELSIDQLREIALEAGIAESAFDAALRELETRNLSQSVNERLAADSPSGTRRAGIVRRLARHRILVAATILLCVAFATPGDLVITTLVLSAPVYAAYEVWRAIARRNRPTDSRPSPTAHDSSNPDVRTPPANPADRTTRRLLLRPAL